MANDCCEVFCYDEDKVNRVKAKIEENNLRHVSQLFKLLGDETRLKIIHALCEEEELCVCDVANIIGSTLATASHHLRLLRNSGIATYRKEGKLVFYSLVNEQIKTLVSLSINSNEGVSA
ncbi:metalloregulator ArsR/SmtB family transcription factor [Aneurinibacillus sp. Ricciae_BoGa-3]|uniref:ArsR/SmtB family transcription factor n=1 Tax=Aneurinibacillus sp. Ricciae_BoGa-3 TaxID=3022697 RepID=UPI00233FC8EE|nr:metalloregulator ArsR/SmtB family transcription factor [Aneurinibacillus sp. Ricciae_BoGa-3]WCK54893.1 metalloregulator ArsR/SmtB family transcription factor [Aneurinibacillus sp. Ricciae_BoGa-3]